jgi:hypothetical protein
MKPLLAASFLAFSVAISPIQAGSYVVADNVPSPKETAIKYFEQMDQNGDGAITKAEFEKSTVAKMIKLFSALQPDDNGLVKKSEFIENFIKAHSKPKFES